MKKIHGPSISNMIATTLFSLLVISANGLVTGRAHVQTSPLKQLRRKTTFFPSAQSNLVATCASCAAQSSSLLMIRGGGMPPTEWLSSSLQSGPWGILGLWAVSSAVVIPATLYRQAYSFSVGYGFSVMAMGLVLAKVLGGGPLLTAAIFYGGRLGSYLLLRNMLFPEKAEQTKSFDKSTRLKRIPFAASVALFYSFLMTPALYVMRNSNGNLAVLSQVGTGIAFLGAVLEAIADKQKMLVKKKIINDPESTSIFDGPTRGVYQLSRHPNYAGELVFWFGVLVAGLPYLGKSVQGWVCSVLGFYGIYSIMTNATRRLDERQLEKYGGQKLYDEWRASVKAPIFPFFNHD